MKEEEGYFYLKRKKMIKIKKKNEQEFLVTIEEKGSSSKHAVTVDEAYYQNLTNGKITREVLIKRSFEFLLEKEPKESILSKFNLRIIKKYFPEYEQKIRK